MRVSKTLAFPFDLQGRFAADVMREVAYEINEPIFLAKEGREINLNSLLGVLSLGVKKGDLVAISSYSEESLNKCIDIIKKEEKDNGASIG